jgi:hypothetical protein
MPGWTGAPQIVPARIVWRTELGQQLSGEWRARRRAGEAAERGDLDGRGRCPASSSGVLIRSQMAAFGDDEMDDVFPPGGARSGVLPVHSPGCLVEYPAGRPSLGKCRHGNAVAGHPAEHLGHVGGRVGALLRVEAPPDERPPDARVIWPPAGFRQHCRCRCRQCAGDVLAVLRGSLLPLHVHIGAGELVPAGPVNYHYALGRLAKHTFSMLDHFAWWRLIRLLKRRHHRNWTDVRRSLVTATGAW